MRSGRASSVFASGVFAALLCVAVVGAPGVVLAECPPAPPGMLQPGFFPLEPGGPLICKVRPLAWMAPVYTVDLALVGLGIYEAARHHRWPGPRWQTAAAVLGVANLVGGLVGLIGAARGDFGGEFDWVPHAVVVTASGALLFGVSITLTATSASIGPAAAP